MYDSRETCCLHLEAIFTEEAGGLIEILVTRCNNKDLNRNMIKESLLVLDCQRNRSPPVHDVIHGEEVKTVVSCKYLEDQINQIELDSTLKRSS